MLALKTLTRHTQGNAVFKRGDWARARDKYLRAQKVLNHVMDSEMEQQVRALRVHILLTALYAEPLICALPQVLNCNCLGSTGNSPACSPCGMGSQSTCIQCSVMMTCVSLWLRA